MSREQNESTFTKEWFVKCTLCGSKFVTGEPPKCAQCGAARSNVDFDGPLYVNKDVPKPIRVYVAGASAERHERASRVMKWLRDDKGEVGKRLPIEITYDWPAMIDCEGSDARLTHERRLQIATEEFAAIESADVMVFLVPNGASSGAWAELGYALAKGIPVYASGGISKSVFGTLVNEHVFHDDEICTNVIRDLAKEQRTRKERLRNTALERFRSRADIPTLCARAHETAKSKGFYEKTPSFPEACALIHSEVSEALEAWREGVPNARNEKGKPEGVPSELADICIRVFDTCGHLRIDLEKAILDKMEYNATRPHKHGGKRI